MLSRPIACNGSFFCDAEFVGEHGAVTEGPRTGPEPSLNFDGVARPDQADLRRCHFDDGVLGEGQRQAADLPRIDSDGEDSPLHLDDFPDHHLVEPGRDSRRFDLCRGSGHMKDTDRRYASPLRVDVRLEAHDHPGCKQGNASRPRDINA